MAAVDILDLRKVPQAFDLVADRIWRAWWQPDGRRVAEVEAALREVTAKPGFPFSLVAMRQGVFLGTVTSISSDIQARPDLRPCLAALWVEPVARGQGIGERLCESVLQRLADQGFEQVYLCARPLMRSYYQPRGWTMIESDVDADHLDVYRRALGPQPARPGLASLGQA